MRDEACVHTKATPSRQKTSEEKSRLGKVDIDVNFSTSALHLLHQAPELQAFGEPVSSPFEPHATFPCCNRSPSSPFLAPSLHASHLRRWWLPSYLLCQGLKDAARCRDLADALATLPCTASSLRSAADGDVPFTTRSWVRRSVAASDGRLRLGKKKEKRAEE